MKHFITVIILISLGLFQACHQPSKNNSETKNTPAQTRDSSKQTEPKRQAPALSVSGNYHRNLLGEVVVNSEVTNSSNTFSYTDVRIEITYFKKVSIRVDTASYMSHDTFPPKSFKNVEFKIKQPEGTSLKLSIAGARVVD